MSNYTFFSDIQQFFFLYITFPFPHVCATFFYILKLKLFSLVLKRVLAAFALHYVEKFTFFFFSNYDKGLLKLLAFLKQFLSLLKHPWTLVTDYVSSFFNVDSDLLQFYQLKQLIYLLIYYALIPALNTYLFIYLFW